MAMSPCRQSNLLQVAFLAGSIAEYNTGATLIEQAKSNPILGLLLTFWVSWASLIPIMKGARSEAFGGRSPHLPLSFSLPSQGIVHNSHLLGSSLVTRDDYNCPSCDVPLLLAWYV